MHGVIPESGHQDDSGHAMDASPQIEMAIPRNKWARPPGLRKLQRKSGQRKNREADENEPVGDAEVAVGSIFGLLRRNHAHRAPREFAEKVDELMEEHEADRERDHNQVEWRMIRTAGLSASDLG